ncbi:hypothetical protein SETIT_2G158800v2 [Setaria italica]|uniref:Late embryogenesis abundant protein LEA-2 subgroup domain-containing protein n=1 Tax=Setaria italica TaxID=4555 RepID=A0A368Q055_SETIT|nr:hypothetical protein SETIT_2G158800v2 [Setaria italica]
MGDSSGESVCPTTRWRFLARSAVALVVSVLAAAVVVRAVLLMLHPRMLQLKIAPSDVYVQRSTIFGDNVYTFTFYLEAANPSDRAFVYYSNITVQFDDEKGDLIAKFNLTPPSISLAPQEPQQYVVRGLAWHAGDVGHDIDQRLFAKDNEKIDLVVMRLYGLVKVNEDGVTTSRPSAYNCQPLAIVNQKLSKPSSNNHQGNCVPSVL